MKQFFDSAEAVLGMGALSALLFLTSVIMVGYFPEKELTIILLMIAFGFSACLTVGIGTSFGKHVETESELKADDTAKLYSSNDHSTM